MGTRVMAFTPFELISAVVGLMRPLYSATDAEYHHYDIYPILICKILLVYEVMHFHACP
jgi:hypothetical protein